jgi:NTP pyrophosphatase (non-canonical NTP hydrolase)
MALHRTSERAQGWIPDLWVRLLDRYVLSALRSNMKYRELEESALKLNELYEALEIELYGRVWSTEELALGFVGDIGDLAKLIQANAGIRNIDNFKAKLGHELSDCLWSVIVLANKCGIDLEAEFSKNTKELMAYVSKELET